MTREGVSLLSAFAPPKRIWMKETKFAAPCFVLRQQLEFGGSVRLCPALPRRPPKRLPLFPRGLRGAAPAPAPFYRQPHGLGEFLSFADSSRFGRSASPTRQRWGGISRLAICAGGWQSGAFWRPGHSPPGAAAAAGTATSGHLHRAGGSGFTPKLGRLLTLGSVTRQRRDEGR